MKLPRFIPKWLFQLCAVLLLLLCFALTVYWVWADLGLYRVLSDWLGRGGPAYAPLLTFLVLFLFWLVLVIPLRIMSFMPTTKEELGTSLKDGLAPFSAALARSYKVQKAKNEVLYAARDYSPQLRRRARLLGLGFLITGLAFGLVTVLTLPISLANGYVLKLQIILAILSPVLLLLLGVVQLITGKSVIRK